MLIFDLRSTDLFFLNGYFRKLIFQYSIIARPLTNLLRAETKFEFDERERESFARKGNSLRQYDSKFICGQRAD